jgi:hypothetical protein
MPIQLSGGRSTYRSSPPPRNPTASTAATQSPGIRGDDNPFPMCPSLPTTPGAAGLAQARGASLSNARLLQGVIRRMRDHRMGREIPSASTSIGPVHAVLPPGHPPRGPFPSSTAPFHVEPRLHPEEHALAPELPDGQPNRHSSVDQRGSGHHTERGELDLPQEEVPHDDDRAEHRHGEGG